MARTLVDVIGESYVLDVMDDDDIYGFGYGLDLNDSDYALLRRAALVASEDDES